MKNNDTDREGFTGRLVIGHAHVLTMDGTDSDPANGVGQGQRSRPVLPQHRDQVLLDDLDAASGRESTRSEMFLG